MPRSRAHPAALIITALIAVCLAGCDLHDKTWDTDSGSGSGHGPGSPTPAPLPTSTDTVVSVAANGAISCKLNGAYVGALSSEEVLRNEGSASGTQLLVVQDNVHGREKCFVVPANLSAPDISSDGGTTIRRLGHSLFIEADSPSVVELFTQDSQDDVDDTVMFAGEGEILPLANRLNAEPALIDGRDTKHGQTALARAVDAGRTEVVDFLLARKANTEVRDSRGYTALHVAVIRGRLSIVQRLVQHGADVNAVTSAGNTPMHLALRSGRTDIADYLASAGADSNRANQAGRTPMQIALDKEFDVNEQRDYGPFDDGSSLRYTDRKLYVRHANAENDDWDEYELPASREKWTSLQGTHFMVRLHSRGTHRITARYHADNTVPSP